MWNQTFSKASFSVTSYFLAFDTMKKQRFCIFGTAFQLARQLALLNGARGGGKQYRVASFQVLLLFRLEPKGKARHTSGQL